MDLEIFKNARNGHWPTKEENIGHFSPGIIFR